MDLYFASQESSENMWFSQKRDPYCGVGAGYWKGMRVVSCCQCRLYEQLS